MTLDAIVVTLVVGGAVAYLAWTFLPHRRKTPPACAACTHGEKVEPAFKKVNHPS